MPALKGTIALDIDGTITVHHHELDQKVKKYLEKLGLEGWQLLFVTGRTFSFSEPILKNFHGPFLIAVQNGAALYQMPGEKLKMQQYLPSSVLSQLREILQRRGVGLLIESGRENQDECYYYPEDFDHEDQKYLQFRMSISTEKWQKLSLEYPFSLPEFAVGKFFAQKETARMLADEIASLQLPLHVMIIRDPFRPGFYLGHVNHKAATKGRVIDGLHPLVRPLIVAGDDYNDLDMLKKGDIKIVMGNAPPELYPWGDIIAPPASDNGIIPALEEAIKRGESCTGR